MKIQKLIISLMVAVCLGLSLQNNAMNLIGDVMHGTADIARKTVNVATDTVENVVEGTGEAVDRVFHDDRNNVKYDLNDDYDLNDNFEPLPA